MALSRVKTWSAGEILTASDLNTEFNNILNNAISLISPATADFDMDGNQLILDGDADTVIVADTDDQIDFDLGGTHIYAFKTVATAVNGIEFTGSVTTSGPIIAPFGSDSNIDININPKGTGSVVITGDTVMSGDTVMAESANEILKNRVFN